MRPWIFTFDIHAVLSEGINHRVLPTVQATSYKLQLQATATGYRLQATGYSKAWLQAYEIQIQICIRAQDLRASLPMLWLMPSPGSTRGKTEIVVR